MAMKFREVIATALPSEEGLRSRLASLKPRDWTEVAGRFGALLPEFDSVIALAGAQDLADLLAQTRGVPTIAAAAGNHRKSTLAGFVGEAVIVTEHLTDGVAELRTMWWATRHGVRVIAVVAGIERTNAAGRIRLELQDIAVLSAVQLADTPVGLVFERRTPQNMAH